MFFMFNVETVLNLFLIQARDNFLFIATNAEMNKIYGGKWSIFMSSHFTVEIELNTIFNWFAIWSTWVYKCVILSVEPTILTWIEKLKKKNDSRSSIKKRANVYSSQIHQTTTKKYKIQRIQASKSMEQGEFEICV